MTRRKFFTILANGATVVVLGMWQLAKKAPRKFVRAVRLDKYPGRVKASPNLKEDCKWSG